MKRLVIYILILFSGLSCGVEADKENSSKSDEVSEGSWWDVDNAEEDKSEKDMPDYNDKKTGSKDSEKKTDDKNEKGSVNTPYFIWSGEINIFTGSGTLRYYQSSKEVCDFYVGVAASDSKTQKCENCDFNQKLSFLKTAKVKDSDLCNEADKILKSGLEAAHEKVKAGGKAKVYLYLDEKWQAEEYSYSSFDPKTGVWYIGWGEAKAEGAKSSQKK